MKAAVPNAKDLHAVVDSAFAVIFFGTPHRGTNLADFGLRITRVASAMTLKPYNPNIVMNLAKNNEVLKSLRRGFDATLEYMISRNQFESSTFQEDKGFSKVAGFTGKVCLRACPAYRILSSYELRLTEKGCRGRFFRTRKM
jgi:hypothetical protein